MLVGFHHAALSVPDIEQALDFYVGTLGFSVVSDETWDDDPSIDRVVGLEHSAARLVVLASDNAFLELFEYRRPVPLEQAQRRASDHGITHLCFETTDIEADHARLRAAGVAFNSEPLDTGDGIAVYGRDPFGNIIELLQPLAPPCPTLRDRPLRPRTIE